MNNKHLKEAKKQKFDEFYTLYEDINIELNLYKDHFKNKVIYCNCDDPAWSNFWKYFKDNFHEFQIKKLISTYYSDETYKTEYDGTTETRTKLNGNGDFRSDECVELLKQADIIATNPPFSLWSEFFNLLMENNKQFIILGTILKAGMTGVLNKIQNKEIWLGINSVKKFILGDGYYKNYIEGADGRKYKQCMCYWYTNMKTRHKRRDLFEKQKEQPKAYDDYQDIMNFDSLKDIDLKYERIGVPVSVLQYDYEKYYELDGKIKAKINDKYKFIRIILKRKEPPAGSVFYS